MNILKWREIQIERRKILRKFALGLSAIVAIAIIGGAVWWGVMAYKSNPILSPNSSKAISEKEQAAVLNSIHADLHEQNVQLKRIADALEKK